MAPKAVDSPFCKRPHQRLGQLRIELPEARIDLWQIERVLELRPEALVSLKGLDGLTRSSRFQHLRIGGQYPAKRGLASTQAVINNAPMSRIRTRHLAALALVTLACSNPVDGGPASERGPEPNFALVIHGGAGAIKPDSMSEELEGEYRSALTEALTAGHRILEGGGSSLDAVEQVLRLLEDEPLFNAGKGAVFTADGRNELDASIMDGSSSLAGAVAGVTRVRHPISAARAVMERTEHVLLAGPGAEAFAEAQGLEMVEPEFFYTERRWKSLERVKEREQKEVAARDSSAPDKYGTVGAVALDLAGRIAAGTSTGGMTNKKHGRIGDAPIIGAGTYANRECGVSATGHGEYFIRFAVAFDVCARMRYSGESLAEAADAVIHETLIEAGGSGGVIALDATGTPALVFNSDGMYRGYVLADGEPHVAIFKDN